MKPQKLLTEYVTCDESNICAVNQNYITNH